MQTIVYAVTSGGRDAYSVATRVSATSVRVTNPNARIVIVCDSASAESMERVGDPLLSEVDDWIVCSTPAGDSAYRSRFVKTSLRNLIEGRFLFLDGDTLVRDDLSEVFSLSCDVAGCPNHSKDKFEEQIWPVDLNAQR
jgi:hypothetical protein